MKTANLPTKLLPIIAGLGLYLLTTGISYATFNYLRSSPNFDFEAPINNGGRLTIDPSEPRTEQCPLNGRLYTKTEKEAWEQRRPLTVMIENHEESRPQSGLNTADVIYEAVAEGGITRFLAVYLCDAQAKETLLGPVRSARTYYLDWASEYGETPLYAHVGGANLAGPANALGQIQDYGWGGRNGNDLNQFSIGYPTFWRDYERLGRTVATEHTMYSTTEKLWKIGEDRGWSNEDQAGVDWQDRFQSWKFEERENTGDDATNISFKFWDSNEYDVSWSYSPEMKQYTRSNGGREHKDLNADEQLNSKVIIVQFARETGPIDELKHLLYKTTGSGTALVFQDGKVVEANWKKLDREERTIFTDKTGKEIIFSPGRVWIEVLPIGNTVDY